ncbi:hypothetical protein [Streptomyces sp. NPDC055140]
MEDVGVGRLVPKDLADQDAQHGVPEWEPSKTRQTQVTVSAL